MEYQIIRANITSWNLIFSNLMPSTNQLPRKGSYWQTLLNKLILLLEEEKPYYFPPLWIKSVKKLNSIAHLNITALYFFKLGSTYSTNEPSALNFLLIRFHSSTRKLCIFNCGVSLESVTFNGTKYKEKKLKAVFNTTIICKLWVLTMGNTKYSFL